MGLVNGTVTIAGKTYPFNVESMRDHSYGEWTPADASLECGDSLTLLCEECLTLFLGIKFAHIKNLFVNPDFGAEGLHSRN